jgi:uncharacterized protein
MLIAMERTVMTEEKVEKLTIKTLAYLSLGWLCVGLGVLGIVLPLLPTTPFILVAAFAFSKSSRRFHDWLLGHRIFGPLITDWQTNGIIRLPIKCLATLSMGVMLSLSFYFISVPTMAIVGTLSIVFCVLIFIWSRPSSPHQT